MKATRISSPFPAISIDDFIPSEAIVRAAAESFNDVNDWVSYSVEDNQIQRCSRFGRENIPPAALILLDYIASNFDPNKEFNGLTGNAFPDTSHYGGGMMVTPNSNGEGGYLGMHVDATSHGLNHRWKREYSAILCLSEEYDSSFDLIIHDGNNSHARIPYKFNTLNVFKCSDRSWHGFPEITKGLDRKTLGVMYWSIMTDEDKANAIRAKFNNSLSF
jgi:hypothetical protein|tara:strand:- start:8 stop:661 length:654 start_codon:yes stop_codon:yes gene_type:complete